MILDVNDTGFSKKPAKSGKRKAMTNLSYRCVRRAIYSGNSMP